MGRTGRKKNRKTFAIIVILAAAFLAAAVIFFCRVSIKNYFEEKTRQATLPPAKSYSEVKDLPSSGETSENKIEFEDILIIGNEDGEEANTNETGTADNVPGRVLPAEFNLAVPFTSQAPFAVWDEIHEDACEEASVMMIDAFFTNRNFTAQSADDEIFSIVDWETKTFGYWLDTTAEETAQILREKYGYQNVRVVYDIGINDIKREVAMGRPVILPAAGQLLGNIYFQQPGPLYHMLVVRGWTKEGMIITNDPGTKRGEGYLYEPDVLINAVHDWSGGDVENGRKAMIVVEK
jgi:hypothetical protein